MKRMLASQSALETGAIQEEDKNTREEAKNVQAPSLPITGLTSSSSPGSKTGTIQEANETSQILMLPRDIIERILKLLDIQTLVLSIPGVCKSLYQLCGRYPEAQHPFLGYMGHIYERLMFSKGVPISQLNPDVDFQPQYFRPNVKSFLWRSQTTSGNTTSCVYYFRLHGDSFGGNYFNGH